MFNLKFLVKNKCNIIALLKNNVLFHPKSISNFNNTLQIIIQLVIFFTFLTQILTLNTTILTSTYKTSQSLAQIIQIVIKKALLTFKALFIIFTYLTISNRTFNFTKEILLNRIRDFAYFALLCFTILAHRAIFSFTLALLEIILSEARGTLRTFIF